MKDKQSRRRFLINAGIGGTAFTIVPRFVLGGDGYVPPSDKLYIAGIGVGGKGQSDLTSFVKHPKAEIVCLCDVDDIRASKSRVNFEKAPYYRDYREMLEKEGDQIDAVSISTPDHNHFVQTMAAMEMGKHVYVQKPLTHDIYEARVLTEAATKYEVVTQMGNQGASEEGVRQMMDWYSAGLLGDVHTVHCWTDRPVWPQGISWPKSKQTVPETLNWNLWLGTAPYKDYINKLVPFNWRGWWDYGTGALGDMGCHLMEAPFTILKLKYPDRVSASVGSVYVDEFKRAYNPESCPPSSHVVFDFPSRGQQPPVTLHWMDGGIRPDRPDELQPNEVMGGGANGVLFIGTKGKMMCDTYGRNPSLLPISMNEYIDVPKVTPRVANAENDGHYTQWVEACLRGYEQVELSADFKVAGPLTETVLMGNLAIRSHDIRYPDPNRTDRFIYPGSNIELIWDHNELKVTNFDEANQFVKRSYREGW